MLKSFCLWLLLNVLETWFYKKKHSLRLVQFSVIYIYSRRKTILYSKNRLLYCTLVDLFCTQALTVILFKTLIVISENTTALQRCLWLGLFAM